MIHITQTTCDHVSFYSFKIPSFVFIFCDTPFFPQKMGTQTFLGGMYNTVRFAPAALVTNLLFIFIKLPSKLFEIPYYICTNGSMTVNIVSDRIPWLLQ